MPNLELLGLAVATDPESDDQTPDSDGRYAMFGATCTVFATDSDGTRVFDYTLGEPAEVCMPMPNPLRPRLTDAALAQIENGSATRILSTSARVTADGDIELCGKTSVVPLSVVAVLASNTVSSEFLPSGAPTPVAPDTGGTTPSNLLLTLFILGSLAALCGVAIVFEEQRRKIVQRNGRVLLIERAHEQAPEAFSRDAGAYPTHPASEGHNLIPPPSGGGKGEDNPNNLTPKHGDQQCPRSP